MRALCNLLIIFGVHFYFISEGLYSIQTHVLLFIFLILQILDLKMDSKIHRK